MLLMPQIQDRSTATLLKQLNMLSILFFYFDTMKIIVTPQNAISSYIRTGVADDERLVRRQDELPTIMSPFYACSAWDH